MHVCLDKKKSKIKLFNLMVNTTFSYKKTFLVSMSTIEYGSCIKKNNFSFHSNDSMEDVILYKYIFSFHGNDRVW